MSPLFAATLLALVCQKAPKTLQEWVETIPEGCRTDLTIQIPLTEAKLGKFDIWGLSLEWYDYKFRQSTPPTWQQRTAFFLSEAQKRKGKPAAILLNTARLVLLQYPANDPLVDYPAFSRFLLKAAAGVVGDADADLRMVAVMAMHHRADGSAHGMADLKVALSPEEREWIKAACTKLLNDPEKRVAQKAKEALEKLGK